MKTFKMISFQYMSATGTQVIPLIDGIVINQENSHQSWIVEIYTPAEHRVLFDELLANQTIFDAQIVISFPDNEPAPFSLVVTKIKAIGDYISILCQGKIKIQRKRYAERLLQELLAEGISNDVLLERFEKGMKEHPKLKNT